jgi:hypothetical protein
MTTKNRLLLFTTFIVSTFNPLTGYGAEPTPSDAKAAGILGEYCAGCHADGKKAFKEFGGLDLENLKKSGIVIPGNADKSRLIQEIRTGDMPPEGAKALPLEAQRELEAWVAGMDSDASRPLCVQKSGVLSEIQKDIAATPKKDQPFMRYIDLSHLAGPGGSPERLDLYKKAILKTFNSLSDQPQLHFPDELGPDKSVLRIDLRKLGWSEDKWERAAGTDPFHNSYVGKDGKAVAPIQTATGSASPVIRGDWAAANFSQGELYNLFSDIPEKLDDGALDRLSEPRQKGEIKSVFGLAVSGVSSNYRSMTRLGSPEGGFRRYVTSDAADSKGVHDIFVDPFKAKAEQAGGEAIVQLPNGLFRYALLQGQTQRVDRVINTSIVSDPARPDKTVTNASSCMNCHSAGLIPFRDELAENFVKYPDLAKKLDPKDRKLLSGQGVLDRVLPQGRANANAGDEGLKSDNSRYLAAVSELGLDPANDPVSKAVLDFESPVSIPQIACEVGMTEEELRALASKHGASVSTFRQVDRKDCSSVPRSNLLDDVSGILSFKEFGRIKEVGKVRVVGKVTPPAAAAPRKVQVAGFGGETPEQREERLNRFIERVYEEGDRRRALQGDTARTQ